MYRKSTIADLRRFSSTLIARLGMYWKATVYTQKECVTQGLPFDPPCAYMRVECKLGKIDVCVDGEVYIGDNLWFEVDLAGDHEKAAALILEKMRA